MLDFKDIRINRVDMIEKFVAEFDITALRFFETIYAGDTIHYGAFKVKVYETNYNNDDAPEEIGFTGYTNLRLRDPDGKHEGGIGYGLTIEESLQKTTAYFLDLIEEYKLDKGTGLSKEDFVIIPYDEF